jgi:hypothetical protein
LGLETIAMNFFGKKICFSRNYRHLLLDAFGGSSPLRRREKSEKIDPGGGHP